MKFLKENNRDIFYFSKVSLYYLFYFKLENMYRLNNLHNRMVLSAATCASSNYMSLSNRNSVS